VGDDNASSPTLPQTASHMTSDDVSAKGLNGLGLPENCSHFPIVIRNLP
jgi:hypothetical protein